MTQEEKQLLLKDLSARLPYGVKGLAYIVGDPCLTNTNIVGIINESIVTDYESPMLDLIDFNSKDIIIKPYLRPLSSMTEEEKKELKSEFCVDIRDEDNGRHTERYGYVIVYHNFKDESWYIPFEAIDWLNKHHFDYRGLIEKGLALPAPDGMYNTK